MSESIERWHVSQYVNGETIAHQVFTEYTSGLTHIRRKGLLSGTNVLARASRCECRGRLT